MIASIKWFMGQNQWFTASLDRSCRNLFWFGCGSVLSHEPCFPIDGDLKFKLISKLPLSHEQTQQIPMMFMMPSPRVIKIVEILDSDATATCNEVINKLLVLLLRFRPSKMPLEHDKKEPLKRSWRAENLFPSWRNRYRSEWQMRSSGSGWGAGNYFIHHYSHHALIS